MPHDFDETVNHQPLKRELSDTVVSKSLSDSDCTLVSPEACLVQIHPTDANLGRRYTVTAELLTIGREIICDICLSDGSVSRTHCRLEMKTDRRFHVTDMGSTNGTFLNNTRVRSSVLEDGDYLRVGPCIYRFLAGGNVQAEYHEELHRLAVLDPLTGVHNRRSLLECLDREVERARRYHRPLAVLLLDVDRLGEVNDEHGHLAGDFTLKDVATRLAGLTRKHEMLARSGGDEFAVVLPETDLGQAVRCGDRFRRAVAARLFVFEGQSYRVTASGGVACLGIGESGTSSDLLARAADRLDEAKKSGRNRVMPALRVAKFGTSDQGTGPDPSAAIPIARLLDVAASCRDESPPKSPTPPPE